jgi:hypothetical protein
MISGLRYLSAAALFWPLKPISVPLCHVLFCYPAEGRRQAILEFTLDVSFLEFLSDYMEP